MDSTVFMFIGLLEIDQSISKLWKQNFTSFFNESLITVVISTINIYDL